MGSGASELGVDGAVTVLEAGLGWWREINAEAFDPVGARIVEASCPWLCASLSSRRTVACALRTGSNTRYEMRDAALAAFSVFFTQSPSFLSHQRSMQLSKGTMRAQSSASTTSRPITTSAHCSIR
jgi:hypothetical protein